MFKNSNNKHTNMQSLIDCFLALQKRQTQSPEKYSYNNREKEMWKKEPCTYKHKGHD